MPFLCTFYWCCTFIYWCVDVVNLFNLLFFVHFVDVKYSFNSVLIVVAGVDCHQRKIDPSWIMEVYPINTWSNWYIITVWSFQIDVLLVHNLGYTQQKIPMIIKLQKFYTIKTVVKWAMKLCQMKTIIEGLTRDLM